MLALVDLCDYYSIHRQRNQGAAMQTNQPRTQDCMRAFVSRGVDLLYQVKRASDGKVLAARAEKIEAKHAAKLLGYSII